MSIPASQLVNVIPGVLGAGGNPLSLNSVFLTQDPSIPIGSVKAFSTLADVQAWFGASAPESLLAAVYFAGFTGSTTLPGTLYFSQYNVAPAAGYLRSGVVSGLTLTQLQALSGTLIVPVNGSPVTSPSINLSGATSFTNAAALMQTGLRTTGAIFSGTGAISTTNLTVSAVASGALHPGDIIAGSGLSVGTKIVSQTSGTPGGIGVYVVDISQTFASGAITSSSLLTVTYDSQRGTFLITSPLTGVASTLGFATGTLAAGVKLTAVTGATLSAGAIAATPSSALNAVTLATQNWALFMTVWEPIIADKLLFAAWVQTTNQRFAYVCWDSDVTPLAGDAPSSFGAQIKTLGSNGVFVIWDTDGKKAAFVCGTTASIDFTQAEGRITYAYKGQAGLSADITNATTASNLKANGYNFYGAYATANDLFVNLQNGAVAGPWAWFDPYVNQIWMNAAFQLAYMDFLSQAKSVPYNAQGYSLLRAVALDPITAALNFGAIRPGVTLSNAQKAQVNTAAGLPISSTIEQQGWYLLISDASPSVRAARGSPPMTFWYTDGGSIQQIVLASIDIQ